MKRLYPKIMALVGGVFAVIIMAIVIFVHVSGRRQVEREWLARAETLNRVAFEALYASLAHRGGREDNRRVLARLQETGAFTRVRVVKSDAAAQQFGVAPDQLPEDALDLRALAGEEVGAVYSEEGYRVVRFVTPLRIEPECQSCHMAQRGEVAGIISSEISLREYEDALRQRRDVLLMVFGGGLLVLGVLTFGALQRLVILPLQAIQRGTTAIAAGDLDHRLEVETGDELEALAKEFNHMAGRLKDSYGQVAEGQGRILAAIEASKDAIWVSDAERHLLMVNSAMERLIGRDRDELLGQTCRDLLGLCDPGGASLCDASCPFLQATYDTGSIEGRITAVSGADTWAEISYGCVRDPSGRVVGMVHILRDLTQRIELERLKDEFISLVSHELRTPLNHIKGFATTLLQTDVEWDAAMQRDFLGSISREADRLANLVEKILHLSRLETGGLPMEKEWYQVDDLVDEALQRLRNVAANQRVDLALSPALPALFVDGREIEVVLMNLIENAAKYSAPDAPITLGTELRADRVVFSVADQGPGIPHEHAERIFERFYRVNSAGRRVPGIGLGLAICKRIIEAHDGSIWVASTPGVGSHFCFSLPLDGADDSQDDKSSA